MTYTMFDSVNAAAFPPTGFDATAGYTTGRYPSSTAIQARFPNIPHVTIAVTARVDADCLDVEPGDATPAEAPGWFDRRPANRIIYCAASTINQIRAVMGSRDYLLWSAHYTGKPHICGSGCGYPAADATQWLDRGPNGENVDQSLLSDHFWASITGDDMPSSQEVAQTVWATAPQDLLRAAARDAVFDVIRGAEFHAHIHDEVDLTLRQQFNLDGEVHTRVKQAVMNVLQGANLYDLPDVLQKSNLLDLPAVETRLGTAAAEAAKASADTAAAVLVLSEQIVTILKGSATATAGAST